MKNYFLGGLLAVGMSIPFFAVAASPSGWVLNKSVSSNDWISKIGCTTAINSTSCDYTGPSKALRVGYDYEFADEFWAGDRDRRMKNFCYEFKESSVQGDYNRGDNPTFSRTPEIANNGYRVNKNSSLVVLRANKIYQVKDVPASRSSSNLFVKYLIEYANDEAANMRYQHTECYPYEISRCGDGKVDTDWFKKDPSDPAEECDPAAPEWKNRTDGKKCSASCTIEQAPICNSTYNGKRVYTSTSSQYLNGSEGLCVSGSAFSFTPSRTVGNPRIFTWGCTSSVGSTSADACNYKQYRCGDGIVSAEGTNWNYSNGAHYELCDPAASGWKNRTDGKKCNSSCNVEYVPASCGPVDREDAKYNSNHPNQRITENTAGLCGTGQLKAGSFKYDEDTGKYTWDCVNGSSTAHCDAQDLWCGDGLVNGNEKCDPADGSHSGWGDGCSNTCEPTYGDALCGSQFDEHTKYQDVNNQRLTKNTPGLCDKGEVVEFSFDKSTGKYKWKCKNGTKESKLCTAEQLWCGDGKKNGDEKCDPADGSHSGWGDGGCSKTCEPEYGVKCGSKYNGKTTYLDISKDWINENTPGLCDSGNVVNFYKHPSSHVYTWQCENHDKVSEQCRADQEWCGDQKRNGNEDCDGTDGCDSECKKIIPTTGCDQIFTGALRLGDSDPFYDVFNAASWKDNYLFFYDVNFKENHGNYDNKAQDPVFNWTSQLINNGMKVSENTSMKVLESNPYHIVTPPTARAWNNLYIEYTIRYDYVNHTTTPSKSNLYSHKECAYYEISRCGDGEIDEEYGEECDPGDSSEKNWGNGGCDENTCTPVNVAGPICNSTYNGQTVENLTENDDLCEEGTVSDFEFDEATNTWTWKCNNVAGVGVQCSATKKVEPTGELKVEKTLISEDKYVTGVDQKLVWQIKVTAIGGDLKNVVIVDNLPEELGYVGYARKDELSKITIDNKQPIITDGGKHIEWNTRGTLLSGQSIILEVETKVVKMPSKEGTTNVACAWAEGLDEKCQPVNIKPTGELKVEKTLISENKYVTGVDQKLVWQIKVTAKDGNIKNVKIKDDLPEVLSYVSYTSDLPSGVTMNANQPTKTNNGKHLEWQTAGVLEKDKSIVLIVTTRVDTMPDRDGYENVACAWAEGLDELCDKEPIEPEPTKGDMKVEKTLISNTKYVTEVGQEMVWEIKVTAVGGDLENVVIKDELPEVLEFVKYKKIMPKGYSVIMDTNQPTQSEGGKLLMWKTSGVLKSGESIVLTVYTKVVKMPKADDDYKNVACAKADGVDELCDKEPIKPSGLKIEKTFSDGSEAKKTFKVGNEVEYKVIVSNIGEVTLNNIKMKDILPKNIKFIKNEKYEGSEYPLVRNSDGTDVDEFSNITLRPGEKAEFIIVGKVTEDYQDSTINNACVYLNDVKIECDSVEYEVEEPAQCKYLELEGREKDFTLKAGGSKTVKVHCKADKKGKITIDCGNGKIRTEENREDLRYNCKYGNSFDEDKTYEVKCFVDDKWPSSNCKKEVTLEKMRIENLLLAEDCFNINAWQASVESGEILPFYYNLANLNENGNDDYYTTVRGLEPEKAKDDIDNYKGRSCSENQQNKIALNSMVCKFKIYDAKGPREGARLGGALYEITGPCLSSEKEYENIKELPLIKAWLQNSVDRNTYVNFNIHDENGLRLRTALYYIENFGTERAHLPDSRLSEASRDLVFNRDFQYNIRYGEYKIELSEIKFLQCEDDGEDYVWKKVESPIAGCSSDFTLTAPYTIQRTPSGNLTASTDELGKYDYRDGNIIKQFSSAFQSILSDTYKENNKVETRMDEFISKYEKLAVKVSGPSFIEDASLVKKVPGKNIYFVEGNRVIIKGSDVPKYSTIVQKQINGSVVVDGNINANAMILTKGSMTFKSDCTKQQIVKGIYYAKGNLYRNGVGHNVDLNESVWCTAGGLKVQGVLIGKGLDNLMTQSRSNLTNWFKTRTSRDGDMADAEKKSILSGASVSIEYSPSIFTKSTMPPGAEDFTTALSIYKN